MQTSLSCPLAWPLNRECPWGEAGLPAMSRAWQRSKRWLERVQHELAASPVAADLRCAYVCGSLGRMEAVPSSDCDLVVVLPDQVCHSRRAGRIMQEVCDCVSRSGLARPKADGVFSTPTSVSELLDLKTAGQVDEQPAVFGKRIQALLDSQPVLAADEFIALQSGILNRYLQAPRVDEGVSRLAWLADDLFRYWRSLASRTRWLEHSSETTWRVTNVKLRHSRMLMCAGLYVLLLQHRQDETASGELLQKLRQVPAERVAAEFSEPAALLSGYEQFLESMESGLVQVVESDEAFARLIASGTALSELVSRQILGSSSPAAAPSLFGDLR